MVMDTWRSAGDVLRWWRTSVLGWTQQQAAERLNVRPNALSNWERGQRAISLDLPHVDRALEGNHLLAGLLWAHGTPDGIEPGHFWTWVFPGESRPVWMWLRAPVERLVVEGEWGVARMEGCFDLGPNGLFITVGASLPDSPVVVQLSSPGWADFGTGDPPADVPGSQVVAALDLWKRSSADGPLMDLFSSTLEARVAAGAPGASRLAKAIPGAVESYLGGPRGQAGPRWRPRPDGIDEVERQRYARLRQARGLSLAALATKLKAETDQRPSRDTLRRFEIDVGRPHHPQLPVALDHVLGAGGRLAMLELRSGRGDGSVTFPPYWRAPFWIEFGAGDGADPWPATVLLRRGRWHRVVEIAGPGTFAAHWFDPSVPIRISAPPEVTWTVGVGRRGGATLIDQNWVPTTVDVAKQAVTDIEEAIYGAFDITEDRAEDDESD